MQKKIKKSYRSFDRYAEQFSLNVKEGENYVATTCGATVSIGTFLVLLVYAVLKYRIMNDYADTMVQISKQERYYSDEIVLSAEMGFNVAFALAEFDLNGRYLEDPDYGTMKAKFR